MACSSTKSGVDVEDVLSDDSVESWDVLEELISDVSSDDDEEESDDEDSCSLFSSTAVTDYVLEAYCVGKGESVAFQRASPIVKDPIRDDDASSVSSFCSASSVSSVSSASSDCIHELDDTALCSVRFVDRFIVGRAMATITDSEDEDEDDGFPLGNYRDARVEEDDEEEDDGFPMGHYAPVEEEEDDGFPMGHYAPVEDEDDDEYDYASTVCSYPDVAGASPITRLPTIYEEDVEGEEEDEGAPRVIATGTDIVIVISCA